MFLTHKAQRARKEKARRARLEVEEEERKKIDAIEHEIMAESRRLQIDRAKKKLYDNNDRVKALHSSLLLSEVLSERTSQIAYKQKIKELRKAEAVAFNVQQAKELEIKEDIEERAILARRKAALEQKHEQLQQLEQVKAKIALEKKRDLEEGELLRREAEEEAIRQHEKELKVREVARKHTKETMKANEALQKYKQRELEREKEAEKAQEAYAAKKEAFLQERKRREADKELEKQKARERMVRMMEDQLEFARLKNERNFELQHAQAVAKEDGIMAEREERRRLEKIAIDKSRQQQLNIRKAMREQKRIDDKAFVDSWKERTKELAEEDELETKLKFWENKQHQNFLKHQMETKAKKKHLRKTKELEGAYVAALSIAEEEDTFKGYAAVCINEWNKRGKSLRPMQLLLNKKEALGSTK